MNKSNLTSFLPKLIVNSFMEAGKSITGQEVAPDDLLVAGIRLYGTMVERGWDAGWGDFIGIMLIGIVILVVIAMLAGTMAVALIEMHLVICGGAILVGFGGFEYTRDIALSYLRYSVSIGVKLLMIMIVYALANALLIDWEATFGAATDMATLITAAGQILGGTICILWLPVLFRLWLNLSSAGRLYPLVMNYSRLRLQLLLTGLSVKKILMADGLEACSVLVKLSLKVSVMLKLLLLEALQILMTLLKKEDSAGLLNMPLLIFRSSIISLTLIRAETCSIMYLLVPFSALILTGLPAIFTMTMLRKCTLLQKMKICLKVFLNALIMKGINYHA